MLLAANVVVGIPLLTATVGLAALLLPDRDMTAIALIALAEYVSIGLVKAPAATWVALDRFPLVAATNVFDAVLRLLAACSLFVWDATIRTLAIALAGVMIGGAVVVNAAVWRSAGRPRLAVAELVDSCRKGASYSIASVSTAVQSNIDQFMLVRARLDVDAGLYALGVRFIGYSMLPLHALTAATVPEIFSRGHRGIGPAAAYARRLVRTVAALSVVGALVAIAVAGPLGRFLGDRFDGVLAVVAVLAGYPLLRSAQNLATTVLMGSGHQRVVARIAVRDRSAQRADQPAAHRLVRLVGGGDRDLHQRARQPRGDGDRGPQPARLDADDARSRHRDDRLTQRRPAVHCPAPGNYADGQFVDHSGRRRRRGRQTCDEG